MEKMLMLGTGHASIEMIKYAKSQGVYTIVTDYLDPSRSAAKLAADEYWMINTGDLDALEKKCRDEDVTAIACGVSEFNLEMTMELSKRLGLNTYCTPEAWHYSRNKRDFKELCMKLGVPMATDYKISDDPSPEELAQIEYPVVVKPVDLSSNRGISFCNNDDELRTAIKKVRKASKNPNMIVERQLHGQEVGACYAMADGEIRLVGVISMNSQPGMPTNCYSISTTVSPYVKKYVDEMNDYVVAAIKKVGCKNGYGWVETILDEDGHFYLLEMGYRLSGDMTFISLRSVANYDALGWIVDYARGKKRDASELPKTQSGPYEKAGCVYMLWANHSGNIGKYVGLEKVQELYPDAVIDFLKYPGDHVEQYMPIGEICFAADDCNKMCEILDQINGIISIPDENGDEMAIKYTDFDHLKSLEKQVV